MIIWENAVGRLLLFTFSDLKLHLFPQITTKQHYRDETEKLSTLNCLKRLSFLDFFAARDGSKQPRLAINGCLELARKNYKLNEIYV